MKRVIVLVISVAFLSYGIGHHLGEESLRPRLMLVEQVLETTQERAKFKDFIIDKCTTEYNETVGEPFTATLEEYLSESRLNNTDLGEKDSLEDNNQMELRL